MLKVQARWRLIRISSEGMASFQTFPRYAKKKNGSETGAGTNRKPVEVVRKSQATEICVEGTVCRLEGTFV